MVLVKSISKFLERTVDYLDSFERTARESNDLRCRIASLNSTTPNPQSFGSGYGYEDEIHEFMMTIGYYREIEEIKKLPVRPREPCLFYQTAEEMVSVLLAGDPNITSFMNFGVGYAYLDNRLAKKFPDVEFVGLDRSQLTKTFNEIQFPRVKNYITTCSDIIYFLEHNRFGNGIFFTARILTLLPKEFIQRLYGLVADAGFKYIIGLEPYGKSRQTGQTYIFSENEQPSVVYVHDMYIHNYPELLKTAGYKIIKAEMLNTNFFDTYHRRFCFVGRKHQ